MQQRKKGTARSTINTSGMSSQTSSRKAAAKMQERGVPAPRLGPQGSDMSEQEETKGPRRGGGAQGRGGGKSQVHSHQEDPFSILESQQPYHEQLEQLRDSFIVYKENCSRCKIQLRPKQAGEQFKKYYFQPKVPFLDDPEKQKVYRKNLINEISRLPEPEPLYLMADKMHLDCLETIGDRSNPAVMREDLGRFYMRRSAQLQHKKYKLLIRWANSKLSSPDLDGVHRAIDHHLSILQQEQDNIHNRLERLIPDDKYEAAFEGDRPSPTTKIKHQPSDAQEAGVMAQMGVGELKAAAYKEETTKLYIEKTDERSVNSCIRQDDFEVYMRIKTYNNKLNRLANKLINKVKWLPFLKRFDMWRESREQLYAYRQAASIERSNTLNRISLDIKRKLEGFGEQDEKAIMAVTERYIFHLKDTQFVSRVNQILSSHRNDVKKPYMLFASNIELKLKLQQLAEDYPTLSALQLEIDNGQQFTYQMQTLFPDEFELQVMNGQFDVEDTGRDPDRQLLERLIKNLGLSRYEILREISQYSEKQRRNSILGALGYDTQLRKAEDEAIENSIRSETHEEFSEQNLIRKIKTIDFFSLSELKLKLRYADWLDYVCFEPTISETQKQQNNLLSASDNPIDSLLKGAFDATDVHDQVSINKILEEASSAHIAKIQAMQHKIIQGEAVQVTAISGKDIDTAGVQASLSAAVKPESVIKKAGAESAFTDLNKAQMKRYEHIQNIDQLNLGLVKNYYSLRLLKSREYKQKLLSLVNYFRAVQRLLAFDLKEHVTREKGVGEKKDLIEPHFGRDGEGRSLSKMASQTGPGQVFAINLHRKLDADEHDSAVHDPVTVNCYKYNGLFNPHSLSTCPMLPKYHRTFGRPSLYESLSGEVDRKTRPLHQSEEMACLMVKRDKIIVDSEKQLVRIYNEFGQPIMYDESINDMVALEEELIKIGSYFINQHEYVQASNDIETATATEEGKMESRANTRPSSMIDRPEIAIDLLKKELDYQFAKVLLVERLLESYEHIYDPLESVRCLQMIVDQMATRPRLNTEASMYNDSYDAETKLLQEKTKFFSDLIMLQRDHEQQENQQAFDFQEMKVKKVSETIVEQFRLNEREKTARVGSDEVDPDQVTQEQFAMEQKIQAKLENKQAKKEALAEIQRKHITEYANEQYTNFAQVLGLPEISMEDLVNKRDQKEPLIQDAIREQAFFTKQLEGYPTYFSKQKTSGCNLGLRCDDIGLLDFYESYTIIPKVNAAVVQAFETLLAAVKPENGLAISTLELTMVQEARIKLAEIVNMYNDGMQDTQTRGQNHLEEDFYMANSDKVLFMMKEFKAEMDPVNLYKAADPLVVSKLDVKSVKNYNFPRINMSEVRDSLEQQNADLVSQFGQESANDKIVRRMIDLARDSCARQLLDKRDRIEQPCDDDDDENFETIKDDKVVRSPSMMRMACNLMEVVRLREELINRISECNALQEVYQAQCALASKNTKVNHSDQINFNTSGILKDQINIVDSNHGKNKVFDLPFMEFDNALAINLDLKSESCIKALMTDLGVEELRAILHYQIMHQQLLTVATLTNQLLIDGPLKGLTEVDLLESKGIVVPNPIINPNNLISVTHDSQNFQSYKQERQRLNACVSSAASDCMYFVIPRKARDRETVTKKFQKVQSRVINNPDYKPEVCLRILRSYRVKLLHEFCQNVLSEVYLDSIKVQTLSTCNQLRWKATLLPITTEKLFTVGRGAVMEDISTFAQDQLYGEELETQQQADITVRDILNGQIINSSLFYIPHSEEIMFTDRLKVEEMTERQQAWLDVHEQDLMNFDEQIKATVQRPQLLNESFQPGITHLKEMSRPAEKTFKPETSVLPQNRVISQIQQQAGGPVKRHDDIKWQMYKVEPQSRQKYGYRKVNFDKAHDYGQRDIFRLLTYTSLILKIFTLEYLMGRNNTPSRQILEMEQKIMTGREFWTAIDRMKVLQDINQLRYGDHSEEIKQRLKENETAADRVIDNILERKKTWYELSEDMKTVQSRVAKIDTLVKDLPHEKRTIYHLNDLLILQHQATFYHFLNGLENILEIYRDKNQDELFYKVMDVRNQAIKRQQGLILNLRNGFYISQASVNPSHISLSSSDANEFAQFMQQHHPIVDERSLIPRQINMLQRIYGVSSDLDNSSKDCLLDSWMTNYANLQNAFYNLDDRSRSFIGTNFPQIDEVIKEYLIYKGILEAPKRRKEKQHNQSIDSNEQTSPERRQLRKGQNYMTEYLLATVEILSYKIEAQHMQRVLMGWISGEGKLPETTTEYTNIMRKYQDMTTLRILQERDHLNDIYFLGDRSTPQEEAKAGVSPERMGRDKKLFLDPETRKTAKFSFFDKVNLIRAETNVIKRMLDQKLIQIATRMITNEHSALSAAIDFAGSNEAVQEFVHPQQQFASTMLQDVDKLGHLDIVNKIGFVQQFLTRLRNRCTEVDTLTSGPGIVFSMKDFNECISIFCKQALKYAEESLRQRTETSQIMGNQYRHLIYLKEMEVVYYRSKCEQFLRNIDVIVNTKMSAKGNQMIYELDVNNRELRSLKDHYYLMERYLREEIKKEFQKKIHNEENKLLLRNDDFRNYKEQIKLELQHECATEIDNLQDRIEELRGGNNLGKMAAMANAGFKRGNTKLISDADAATPENYQIILKLESHIRKYKALTLMKQVLTEEKHQKEIKEMELKLTLNSSLWEQLSESQKRESITRQELELTKRNLTHYEKLIERLYIQLEQLNNEKVRLQRYKSTKQKKISELESKMKDLEILENIDLDKILSEMRSRDKKIERLEHVDAEFNNRLDTTQKQANAQVKGIEKLLAQEREAKNEAFAKLESMRIEMKALEGTDIKNDLWKDKCKELYEISKDLELENDGLRSGITQLQGEKADLQRLNDQLANQQRQYGMQMKHSSGAQLSDQQTIADTQINSQQSRHPTVGTKANFRENMILNRKALVKPMTAKANAYGQKRTQSGHPGAARNNNRLYQRNMTNAQSYHYERGQMIGGEPMQQTLFLSNNTSYPAFSSDVDINSLGLKQGMGGTRNLIVGGANMGGGRYPTNQAAANAQHRYSAVGPQGGTKMPNLANSKKHSLGNYAQSTRAMGQQIPGVQPQGQQLHGVLSSNVIPNSSNFSSAKNSGAMMATATMVPMTGSGLQPGPTKNAARLHTSQGQRMGGNRIRSQYNRGQNTQHQLLGTQMGIVGNTMHQSGVPTSYVESNELDIDSKQNVVESASMVGIAKEQISIDPADLQMQQQMQMNQAAIAGQYDPDYDKGQR